MPRNASRKGALRNQRSSLFSHVDRIGGLVKECFAWAQVPGTWGDGKHSIDGSNGRGRNASLSFGSKPWFIDSSNVSLAHGPGLYWIDWELAAGSDVGFGHTPIGRASVKS